MPLSEETKQLINDHNSKYKDQLSGGTKYDYEGFKNLSPIDIYQSAPVVTKAKYEDYAPYIEGRIDPLESDIDEARAQGQTGLELTAKALGRTATELTLGTIEGVGYLVDAPATLVNTIRGKEEEFDNWFSKGIREFKEGINESLLPIYQTHAAEKGDFFDATSIAMNASSMATTVALMLPAAGAARLTAAALGRFSKLSAKSLKLAESIAAGLASRGSEATMEAGGYVRQNEAVFKQEAEAKYKDQIIKDLEYLPKVGQNGYTQEQLEKDTESVLGKYSKIIDDEVKTRVTESASNVFLGNMALAGIDAFQYSKLLNVFSNPAKNVAGKVANLGWQIGTEAAEEAFQSGLSMEALYGSYDNQRFLGEGFSERIGEYLQDGDLQTAAFWGGVGGGVFTGMGPLIRKAAVQGEQLKAAWNVARIKKDLVGKTKIEDDVITNAIINNARRNNLDNMSKSFAGFGAGVDEEYLQKNGTTKDEMDSKLKRIESDIEFVKAEKAALDINPAFAGREEAKLNFLKTKLDSRNNASNITKSRANIDAILSELEKGGEISAGNTKAKKLQLELNALKHVRANLTKMPSISKDKKSMVSIAKTLEARIALTKAALDSITGVYKDNMGKELNLSTTKDNELQQNSNKIQELEIFNENIIQPVLNLYSEFNKAFIEREDARIKKEQDEAKKKTAEETAKNAKTEEEVKAAQTSTGKAGAPVVAAAQSAKATSQAGATTTTTTTTAPAQSGILTTDPYKRYNKAPELFLSEVKELADFVKNATGDNWITDKDGNVPTDTLTFKTALDFIKAQESSDKAAGIPIEQSAGSQAAKAVRDFYAAKGLAATTAAKATATGATGNNPISADNDVSTGQSSDTGFVPETDRAKLSSNPVMQFIKSTISKWLNNKEIKAERDENGQYIRYDVSKDMGFTNKDWAYVNDPSSLRPGSEIYFVVDMDRVKLNPDGHHKELTFGDEDFIKKFAIIIMQNDENGVPFKVGAIPVDWDQSSKERNSELLSLRKEIFEMVKNNTNSGILNTGLKTTVTYKYGGQLGTLEGENKYNSPHLVLDKTLDGTQRPLIFGVARKLKSGKTLISSPSVDKKYTDIEVDESHSGGVFLIIESANGTVIPVKTFTQKVGAKGMEKYGKAAMNIIASFKSTMTAAQKKTAKTQLEAVAGIPNFNYVFDKTTGKEYFELPETKERLDRNAFIDKVLNAPIQISEKLINKGSYNMDRSKEGVLKTNLALEDNIINTNFEFDTTPENIKRGEAPVTNTTVTPDLSVNPDAPVVIEEKPLAPVVKTEKKKEGKTQKKPITKEGLEKLKKADSKLKEEFAKMKEPISDSDYNNYIDNNAVSDSILQSLAEKVMNKSELSARETAIFSGKTSEVESIIKSKHEATFEGDKNKDDLSEDDLDMSIGRGTRKVDIKLRKVEQTNEEFYEKWNQLQELEWFKSKFGDSHADMIRLQEGLINIAESGGVRAYGQFKQAMVILSTIAKVGTTYHEAFHVVFHLFLNDSNRAAVMSEAKTKYAKEIQQSVKDTMLSGDKIDMDLIVEEVLADQFMEYVISEEGTKKSLGKRIADFFRSIYYAIKQKLTSDLSINQLFHQTQRGHFRDAKFTRDISKFDVERNRIDNVYERQRRVAAFTTTMSEVLDQEIANNPDYRSLTRKEVLNSLSSVDGDKITTGINVLAESAYASILDKYKEGKKNNTLTPEQQKSFIQMLNNFMGKNANGDIEYRELFYKATRLFAYTEGIKINVNGEASSFNDSASEEDFLLETNEEDTKLEGWQVKAELMSAKESISKEVRKELSYIPRLDKKGKIQSDDLGFTVYHDFNEVFPSMMRDLSGILDSDQMITNISNLTKNRPQYQSILDKISGDELLKTAFFNAFSRFQREYTIIVEDITYHKLPGSFVSEPRTTFKLVTANRNNIKTMVIDEMKYNSLDPAFNKLIKADLSVNKQNVQEALKYFESLAEHTTKSTSVGTITEEFLSAIVKKMNEIGMPITISDINELFKETTERNDKGKFITISPEINLTRLLNKVVGIVTAYNKDTNPFSVEFSETALVNELGAIIAKNRFEVLESSFRNSEGNTVYSHQIPASISKQIQKFKNNAKEVVEWYRKTPFYANSPWLEELLDKETLDNFGIVEIDGLKNYGDDKGTTYTSMSEKEYEISTINMYFNNGNLRHAYYRFPVVSDAPKMLFVKFTKSPVKGVINEKSVIDKLHQVAQQEIARITLVRSRRLEREKLEKNNLPIPDHLKKIEFYDEKESEKFLLLDHAFMTSEEVSHINDEDVNPDPKAEPIITKYYPKKAFSSGDVAAQKEIIRVWLEKEAAKDFERLVSLNVLGTKEDASVDHRIKDKKNKWGGSQKEFHKEYFFNSVLANTQMASLFSGDPAFNKKDGRDLYTRTIDFQKRNKQNVSPALMLDTKAVYKEGDEVIKVGETYKGMFLEDYIIPSRDASNIFNTLVEGGMKPKAAAEIAAAYGFSNFTVVDTNKKVIVLDSGVSYVKEEDGKLMAYNSNHESMPDVDIMSDGIDSVNTTDGQSYITLPRYREVLVGLRRWTTRHQRLYPKLLNGTATAEELAFVMQAFKPFYFGHMKMNEEDKVIRPLQIKNSEVLLLPQMISGSPELQKIYDYAMENEIKSINFHSAGKIGTSGVGKVDLSDSNNITIFDLDNSAYGLQQETPEHYIDARSLFGSQIRKLIISDLSDNARFILYGKEYTREQLIELYQDLIVQDLAEAYNDVSKVFERNSDDTGFTEKSTKEIHDMLAEEILSRDMGDDLLDAIKLVPRKNPLNNKTELMFNIPLFHPLHSKRTESLINSLFKNRVTKQKIKGGSFVQVSGFGFSDKLRLVTEKGRLKEAQCMLPWWSKQYFEHLINPTTGKLDINKVPEDLLKMIGYRIPTEDKYSMIPLKVVGFLPAAAGGSILLPLEITKISGSDFDIDKLYIMMPEFKVKYDIDKIKNDAADLMDNSELSTLEYILEELIENDVDTSVWTDEQIKIYDKFKKAMKHLKKSDSSYATSVSKINYNISKGVSGNSKAARDNAKIDIMWSIMTNKDTFPKFITPGGFDSLKGMASDILKLEGKDKEMLVLTLPGTQTKLFNRNMAGVALKGIFANHNAHHAVLQHTDVSLTYGMVFNGKYKTSIHEIKDDKGNFISRNVAEFLAASVDNAKDPVLGFVNVNTYTANIAALLIRMGWTIEATTLFLSQPILKEFTSRYFNEGGNRKTQEDIINKLTDQKNIFLTANNLHDNYENVAVNTSVAALSQNIKAKDKFTLDQYKILDLFLEMQTKAEGLNLLVRANRADTLGAGPTMAANEKLQDLYDQARNSEILTGVGDLLDGNVYPMIHAFHDLGVEKPSQIMGNIYPWNSPAFKYIKDYIRENMNGEMSEKQIETINYELLTFLSSEFAIFKGSDNRRDYVVKRFPKEFAKMKANNKEFFRGNALLNKMFVEKGKKAFTEQIVFRNTGTINKNERVFVKQAWEDLFNSAEYHDFAVKLALYTYYTAGFKFTPSSFSHMLPNSYYEKLEADSKDPKTDPASSEVIKQSYNDFLLREIDSTKTVSEVSKKGKSYNRMYEYFLDSFYRNHSEDTSFVPKIDKDLKRISGGFVIHKGAKTPVGFIVDTTDPKTIASFYKEKKELSESKFVPFVSYSKGGKTYLFRFAGTSPDGKVGAYVIDEKLGNEHQVIEYQRNPRLKSIFDENNPFKGFTEEEAAALVSARLEHTIVANKISPTVIKPTVPVTETTNPVKTNKPAIGVTTNFSRDSVSKDQDYLYLFTDNAGRTSGSGTIPADSWYIKKYGVGKKFPTKTQAVIRGLNNAAPITTMVDDRRTQWNDSQFDAFKKIIDSEIDIIKKAIASDRFKGIKYSSQDQFGKGSISNMKESAPKIWSYLNTKLLEIGIDNNKLTAKESAPTLTTPPTIATKTPSAPASSGMKMMTQEEADAIFEMLERQGALKNGGNFVSSQYKISKANNDSLLKAGIPQEVIDMMTEEQHNKELEKNCSK